ncbi:MAG: hypothetical protein KY432_00655 [Acidobacteria bacterium]|nr:hypothetical protein [Acidobacteriota bacterium]
MRIVWIVLLGAAMQAGASGVSVENELPGPASPDLVSPDLEMIVGTWQGGDGDVLIEEIWSRPASGQLIGMFRMIRGNESQFYELMTIEPLDDGWVMYMRHFSPGLEAWEDKSGALVFDLTEVSERRIVFDQREAETNLIYEREEDELTVILEKEVDGAWKRTPFRYRLVE